MPNSSADTTSTELVSLLQHLEPESSRLAHINNREMPACLTLRTRRTELGLTQGGICTLYGLVQALAAMGQLHLTAEGIAVLSLGRDPYPLNQLRRANIQNFLGSMDSLDITHLSKFERGQQVPWFRARARLTVLFSLIHGKRFEVADLFPELEALPGLKSDIKANNLLDI